MRTADVIVLELRALRVEMARIPAAVKALELQLKDLENHAHELRRRQTSLNHELDVLSDPTKAAAAAELGR